MTEMDTIMLPDEARKFLKLEKALCKIYCIAKTFLLI